MSGLYKSVRLAISVAASKIMNEHPKVQNYADIDRLLNQRVGKTSRMLNGDAMPTLRELTVYGSHAGMDFAVMCFDAEPEGGALETPSEDTTEASDRLTGDN